MRLSEWLTAVQKRKKASIVVLLVQDAMDAFVRRPAALARPVLFMCGLARALGSAPRPPVDPPLGLPGCGLLGPPSAMLKQKACHLAARLRAAAEREA